MWLKIRIWTKTAVLSIIGIYALLFILNNSGQPVKFWAWFNTIYDTSMLVLILFVYMAGVLTALAVRAAFKTRKQVRELRERQKIKAQEELIAKAAKLQTHLESNPTPGK